MNAEAYSSGDLARATGQTVRTIRFYEEQGLLRPTQVSEGGHRRYGADALDRLKLIGDLRELGLPLSEIRSVLELRSSCASAAEFAQRFEAAMVGQLQAAQRRILRLRRLQRELHEALRAVRSKLASREGASCPCSLAALLGATRIAKVLGADEGGCDHDQPGDPGTPSRS